MPVHRGIDHNGPYYQWGYHSKRYYYTSNNKRSRELAKKKARAVEIAAHAHGYKK